MYEFKGKWEDTIILSALSEFRNASGAYTGMLKTPNEGKVKLIIIDEWTEDPDPKTTQIDAINNLIFNQDEILNSLLEHSFKYYHEIKDQYGLDESEWVPNINNPDDLKKIIGVGNIFIHVEEENGLANIGFECGCTWDEEHGLGLVMNGTKLIRIGMAEEAFASNGKTSNSLVPEIPKKYQPHPKYGTLKPFQITYNQGYAFQLIHKEMIAEFKLELSSGSINLKKDGLIMLEIAVKTKKFEFADLLIENKIRLQDGFIRILKTNLEEEILFYLTNKGININDQDKYGNTILFTKCQELAQNYKGLNWNRNNPNKNINEHIAWFEKRILKTKKEILLLYEKWGADPLIENNQRQNCFATSKKLKDKEAIEMEKFLTLLLLPRNLSPDSHKEY